MNKGCIKLSAENDPVSEGDKIAIIHSIKILDHIHV
jgi:hypothetical protein